MATTNTGKQLWHNEIDDMTKQQTGYNVIDISVRGQKANSSQDQMRLTEESNLGQQIDHALMKARRLDDYFLIDHTIIDLPQWNNVANTLLRRAKRIPY